MTPALIQPAASFSPERRRNGTRARPKGRALLVSGAGRRKTVTKAWDAEIGLTAKDTKNTKREKGKQHGFNAMRQ